MSDDPTNLDQRAAAAVTDLHERAGRRPVPAFDAGRLPVAPPSGGHARSGRRMAAIAAAVVLLAGGAVVAAQLVGGDDDGDGTTLTTTTDGARPFLAGWLPDGFEMAGVVTSDNGGTAAEEWFTQLHVYGVDGRPAAGIVLGPRWENLEGVSTTTTTTSVDVDGRSVWHIPAPVGQGTWSVVEAGDRTIVAIGAGLDDEDRDRLAVGSAVDAGRLIVPPPVAERWDLLTVLPDASVAMPSTLYRVTASGELHQSTYAKGTGGTASFDGEDAMVTVTSMAAPGDVLVAAALIDPTADAVEVRDVAGLVGHVTTDSPGGSMPDLRYVTWTEGPGQAVSVVGIGVSEDDLLRIAEDVRPAADDEWDDLERDTLLGRLDDRIVYPDLRTIELGVGELAGGGAWRLVLREPIVVDDPRWASADLLDLTIVVDGTFSNSSTSWEADAPFGSTRVTESGGRRVAGGLLDEASGGDVARIRVEPLDGSAADDATLLEAEGHHGWVAEVPDGGGELVALDAQGDALGRLTIDPGTACGDDVEATGSRTCGYGESTPTTQAGG